MSSWRRQEEDNPGACGEIVVVDTSLSSGSKQDEITAVVEEVIAEVVAKSSVEKGSSVDPVLPENSDVSTEAPKPQSASVSETGTAREAEKLENLDGEKPAAVNQVTSLREEVNARPSSDPRVHPPAPAVPQTDKPGPDTPSHLGTLSHETNPRNSVASKPKDVEEKTVEQVLTGVDKTVTHSSGDSHVDVPAKAVDLNTPRRASTGSHISKIQASHAVASNKLVASRAAAIAKRMQEAEKRRDLYEPFRFKKTDPPKGTIAKPVRRDKSPKTGQTAKPSSAGNDRPRAPGCETATSGNSETRPKSILKQKPLERHAAVVDVASGKPTTESRRASEPTPSPVDPLPGGSLDSLDDSFSDSSLDSLIFYEHAESFLGANRPRDETKQKQNADRKEETAKVDIGSEEIGTDESGIVLNGNGERRVSFHSVEYKEFSEDRATMEVSVPIPEEHAATDASVIEDRDAKQSGQESGNPADHEQCAKAAEKPKPVKKHRKAPEVHQTLTARKRLERRPSDQEADHDYLTPLEQKKTIIHELKVQLRRATKVLDEKQIAMARVQEIKNKEKLEVLAEKESKAAEIKQEIAAMKKKIGDINERYQVSLDTVSELEGRVQGLKNDLGKKEAKAQRTYHKMYSKGKESAKFERRDELEQLAYEDPDSVTTDELTEKLAEVQRRVQQWQSLQLNESYAKAKQDESDADVHLQFLKDSMFHYLTDTNKESSELHLHAMIEIYNFTDVQLNTMLRAAQDKKLKIFLLGLRQMQTEKQRRELGLDDVNDVTKLDTGDDVGDDAGAIGSSGPSSPAAGNR